MANTYFYDLTDAWNALATIFTAIKMDVTDTQSNTASKLIDLQVSSNTKFNVGKRGSMYANVALASAESDSGFQLDLNWNTTANTTGIFVNLIDTASGAGSKLVDLKVANSTVFSIAKTGTVTVNTAVVMMGSLPGSDPLVAGQLWSNSGVVTVSAG